MTATSLAGVLSGTRRVPLADGAGFVDAAGCVRLCVRERPLRPLRAFVDEAVAETGAAVVAFDRLERFVSDEGEDAGLVRVRLAAGRALAVALVVGDEAGLVVSGPDVAVVRLAAGALGLGLGSDRRRRYEHAAPPGWRVRPRPHAVRYLHPAFPRTEISLTVYDASVPADAEDEHRRALLDVAATTVASERLRAHPTLAGSLYTYAASGLGETPLVVAVGALDDGARRYRVEAAAPPPLADAALAALHGLVRSIRPVPRPPVRARPATALHWAD